MSPAGLRREIKKLETKVDECRRLYDGLSLTIPFVVTTFLLGQWIRHSRINELRESVSMLIEKEKEKEKEKEDTMTASSSAMPASESELTIASDTSCVGST